MQSKRKYSKTNLSGTDLDALAHEVRMPGWHDSLGGPVIADFLRSSYLSGGGKKGRPALYALWVLCHLAASMPHPVGLNPINTAVLDAVNGIKTRYCVTSVIKVVVKPLPMPLWVRCFAYRQRRGWYEKDL